MEEALTHTPQGQDKAPRFVRVISVLLVIAGVYIILSTIVWVLWVSYRSTFSDYLSPTSVLVSDFTGIVIAVSVGVGTIISALGLWKMKRWGLYGILALLSFVILQGAYVYFFGPGIGASYSAFGPGIGITEITGIEPVISFFTLEGVAVAIFVLFVLMAFLF